MKFNITPFLLLPFLVPFATAQSISPPQEIRSELTFLSWEKAFREGLFLKNGEELIPLRLYPTSRSLPIPFTGTNPLQIVRTVQDANGEERIVPVAATNLDPDSNRQLLIFVGAEGSSPARLLAFDDSYQTNPPETYRFINWTDMDIACRLGEEIFRLEPRASHTEPYATSDDPHLPMQMVEISTDGHQMLFSSRWYNEPDTRKLVILLPPETGSQDGIRLKIVADYRLSR